MKKILFILIGLCIFVSQNAYSQEVSQETAQRVAENFFLVSASAEPHTSMEVHPFGDRNAPTMFAFSLSNRWVLVAGDRRVQPILAYSDDNGGSFPAEEDMPPAMLNLLEWYSGQIDALRNNDTEQEKNSLWNVCISTNSLNVNNRSVIVSPLLVRNGNENIWKQSKTNNGNDITRSYNKFCPAGSDCTHTVAGCVALATSQVMWYWQWPHAAIVHNDNWSLQLRNYDWSLMPYRLVNESEVAEADMVANLLHDAGVDVYTTYGCEGSSASSHHVPSALQDIYGYNTSDLLSRNEYTNFVWRNMIKSNLDDSNPIIYSGFQGRGGHCFVLDGYNSDNMFHINYGWAGSHNGYYSLDAIYNDYNVSQTMVKDIHPNYPSCSFVTIPSSDVWSTYFVIQNGGGINVGNRTITSGMHGSILSGDYVKLTSGFKVNAGATVYIAVRDMHCNERGELHESDSNAETRRMQQRHETINEESSSQKVLRDGQLYILRDGKTYTVTGMEIE